MRPVKRVIVEDEHGPVAEMMVDGGSGNQGVAIIANPDPPVSGQDLGVRFEFPSPVYFVPKCFIEFVDGYRHEVYFPQGAGQSVYETTIPGSQIYQPVERIVAEDDMNSWLGDIYFGGMFEAQCYLASAASGTLDVHWDYIDWASYLWQQFKWLCI